MNDIMASSDLSSLGNFAALTGTSWVSQGTVTISSCSSVQQLLPYDCCVAHFLAKVFGSSCDLMHVAEFCFVHSSVSSCTRNTTHALASGF